MRQYLRLQSWDNTDNTSLVPLVSELLHASNVSKTGSWELLRSDAFPAQTNSHHQTRRAVHLDFLGRVGNGFGSMLGGLEVFFTVQHVFNLSESCDNELVRQGLTSKSDDEGLFCHADHPLPPTTKVGCCWRVEIPFCQLLVEMSDFCGLI